MGKPARFAATITVVAVLLFGAANVFAADAPAQPPNPRHRDKVCTRCHDENDNTPILSIYQTRHGVASDAHTPGARTWSTR